MKEQTLCLIKPCTACNLPKVIEILEILLSHFDIIKTKRVKMTTEEAVEFYKEHKGKDFYSGLVEFTVSGSIRAIILQGDDAVQKWRDLAGATNPKDAAPGTIRSKFGGGIPNNAVHGSATVEDAKREIKLIFG